VGVTISQQAAIAALGRGAAQETSKREGRWALDEPEYARRHEMAVAGGTGLVFAQRQAHVRAARKAAVDVENALSAGNASDTLYSAALNALDFSVQALPHVAAEFYEPARVTAEAGADRRTERLLDKIVEAMVDFAAGEGEGRLGGKRRPVIVVGDCVKRDSWSSGAVGMQALLAKLEQRCIVIFGSEHCSSRLCGLCGDNVTHPLKQSKDGGEPAEDKGTIICLNKSCPSRARYANRDLNAACTIVNRFFLSYIFGGKLGTVHAQARFAVRAFGHSHTPPSPPPPLH
jgi:hypothetical protein